MSKIQIYRAKPNPAGKDKNKTGPLPAQLLGEWIDLKNVSQNPVRLAGTFLAHAEFSVGCKLKERHQIYWEDVAGTILPPNSTLRIHTGSKSKATLMASVDAQGVDQHSYAEKGNFVLNNDCGDIISLWYKDSMGKWEKLDEATYTSPVAEGQILGRSGSQLIPFNH